MKWFLVCLRKYATFSGRAGRAEFWFFALFVTLITVALVAAEMALGLSGAGGTGIFSAIFILLILLPSIAVTVRRYHDTGRSGWWWLVNFVPLVGGLISLVLCVLRGDPQANRFGAPPSAQP
jgi:uncharacterized membrane protein YhaH (DUF805 family)